MDRVSLLWYTLPVGASSPTHVHIERESHFTEVTVDNRRCVGTRCQCLKKHWSRVMHADAARAMNT